MGEERKWEENLWMFLGTKPPPHFYNSSKAHAFHALPPSIHPELSGLFDIQGIPSLVVLSPEYEVVTHNGKSEVCDDIEGENFPWRPHALCQLNENRANQLNMVRVA